MIETQFLNLQTFHKVRTHTPSPLIRKALITLPPSLSPHTGVPFH